MQTSFAFFTAFFTAFWHKQILYIQIMQSRAKMWYNIMLHFSILHNGTLWMFMHCYNVITSYTSFLHTTVCFPQKTFYTLFLHFASELPMDLIGFCHLLVVQSPCSSWRQNYIIFKKVQLCASEHDILLNICFYW